MIIIAAYAWKKGRGCSSAKAIMQVVAKRYFCGGVADLPAQMIEIPSATLMAKLEILNGALGLQGDLLTSRMGLINRDFCAARHKS